MADIYDVMRCPECGSDDCYQYDTDETEFGANGTGHYVIDCHCNKCGRMFRLYIKFEYSVTEVSTR